MARLVHACWAVCLAALPAAAEQVLVNPGFEDAGKLAPGWSKQGEVAAGDVARTGQGALKLGKSSRIWQVVALERGVVYHGSVWARGRGTVSPAFYEYTDGPAQGYVWTAACPPVTVGEEWQQVRWSYSAGPNEARLKGICFAVRTNGDDAAVFLDDAAVDREPLPAQPSNLVLNPELADADGDGAPDHWLAERRRLSLETVPGGGRALRVAATLFAEDLLPDPGYGDWWRWDRWGEQHGSGWPALPRPLGGAYTVLLESAAVPIEPGSRYDVSLLLRELDVWGEFVAIRWRDGDGQPLAEFEERLGYDHLHQGSTADWVRYTGRATAPPAARQAGLVVGCKLSSGAFWITDPSLGFGLGAPGRHEPRTERGAADLKQGLPKAPAPARPTPPVAAKAKAGVRVSADSLSVGLAGDLVVTLPLRDGRLIGITAVTCAGVPLRAAAPPLSPVIETVPRRPYETCRYLGFEPDGKGFRIRSQLVWSGGADTLDWLLQPVQETIAGRAFAGLRYSYRFHGEGVKVRRIMDRATWEVGGRAQGLAVGSELHPLGPASTYCLASAYRYVAADAFDYQTGPAGTLVSYLERHHTSLFMRAATPEFVVLQDTFLFPDSDAAETTPKRVLYRAGAGSADDWAAVRDDLYARFRKQVGAPPEPALEPAAMYIGYGGLEGIAGLKPEDPKIANGDYYLWVAEHAVPKLAELGFKRVMMVLPRGPWNWPVKDINHLCPETTAQFKRLCDTAHQRGMKVIAWYGSVQNLDQAATWTEHPEFILNGPGGQRSRTYYSPWGWPGKLAAGFHRYTLDGLREARQKTGLDGLWLDSYCSATHLMETAEFADAVHQADGLIPWHAAIEQMGYVTYCEGGPHGLGTISDGGFRVPADPARWRPEVHYKQGLYLQQPWRKSGPPHNVSDMGHFLAGPATMAYYRLLANRCCPIVDLGHFGTDLEAVARLARANIDFAAVADLMVKRHLLGRAGVEWTAPKGRAVFAFADQDYAVPKGLTVKDVTAGVAVKVPASGKITLKRWHTYRMAAR